MHNFKDHNDPWDQYGFNRIRGESHANKNALTRDFAGQIKIRPLVLSRAVVDPAPTGAKYEHFSKTDIAA